MAKKIVTMRGYQVVTPLHWQNMIVEKKSEAFKLAKQLGTPKSALRFRPYSWKRVVTK